MSTAYVTPPPPGSGIQWSDHLNALLSIEVLEVVPEVRTVNGVTTAVRANVSVLAGNGSPEYYEDTLIFPKVLVSQTRRSVGKTMLARLGQGVAKPGQSAPWLLQEPSADDVAIAQDAEGDDAA